MSKVILDMSMSLDGFIAGPNDEPEGLHDWFFSSPSGVTDSNREVVEESVRTTGAIVTGRRTYDQGDKVDGYEYRIMLFPVVVGSGKRLFRDGSDTKALRLVETKTFGSGVVVLSYQPAGNEAEGQMETGGE